MTLRIVIALAGDTLGKWADAVRAALPDAIVTTRDARGATSDPLAEPADYALVWRPHPSLFIEQPRLKAVFNLGAGIDALASMPAFPRSVPLIRLEDAGMAQPMAHYALAVVLRHALRFDEYARRQAEQAWAPRAPHPPERFHVGILGLGAIGRVIAGTIAQHGFRVRGFARTRHALDGVDVFAGESEFQGFLSGLNVLINALPLTSSTAGILCRSSLERLADGAHVVNIARGHHLVEADLLALLDGGKLGGATLDVFSHEPLAPGHPFWTHPLITVTPHVSGVTLIEESARQVAHKIRSLERGEPVTGVVDWMRGY